MYVGNDRSKKTVKASLVPKYLKIIVFVKEGRWRSSGWGLLLEYSTESQHKIVYVDVKPHFFKTHHLPNFCAILFRIYLLD